MALLLASLLGGCGAFDRLPPPIEHNPRWWEEVPPTASPTPSVRPVATPTPGPRCVLDVLESEPPEPFDLVGLVEVKPQGPVGGASSALEAAKIEACRIGGDAIVLLYRKERKVGGVEATLPPIVGGVFVEPELRAAVIRYRR